MSLTYGFYNSLNGDRKYNTMQISNLFDGIIKDGIFMSIGTSMVVTATSGMIVSVGEGRAWFNHTWTHNDSPLLLAVEPSEVLLPRYDAVVLEINAETSVRMNSVKILKGTPSTSPTKPAMADTHTVHQYPLCYIYVAAKVTAITQANITNMVGTSKCPFVTGILSTVNIDSLVAQWGTQWLEWLSDVQNDTESWSTEKRDLFIAWTEQQKSNFDIWITELRDYMTAFKNASESDFVAWFNNVKGQLSTDVAGNLQNQIDELTKKGFDINNLFSFVGCTMQERKVDDKYVNTLKHTLTGTKVAEMVEEKVGEDYVSTLSIYTKDGLSIERKIQKTDKKVAEGYDSIISEVI